MAQATIHLTEHVRGNNITWDVAICQSCRDEHVRLIDINPRKGEGRKERPYVGPVRECAFCEDAAEAAAAEAGR